MGVAIGPLFQESFLHLGQVVTVGKLLYSAVTIIFLM